MTNLTRLTSDEISTIRIALVAWSDRCSREAVQMDAWSADESFTDPETRSKCLANAAASRRFSADAEALLDVLRG